MNPEQDQDIKSELKLISASLNNFNTLFKSSFDTLISYIKMIPPVGYIYIQFPGELSPEQLWSQAQWQNVSSDLAGDLIRFEGGSASAFNSGVQTNTIQAYSSSNGPNNVTVRKWKRIA